jgi:predicted nucleic acid-binding protein
MPDVNVWLALTVGEHIHNAAAREWIDTVDGPSSFAE